MAFTACNEKRMPRNAAHSSRKHSSSNASFTGDALVRSKLRSSYDFLLKTAENVEVARREVAELIASHPDSLKRVDRLLKKDPEMIAETAEKLAGHARALVGKKPISLHGKGPLAAYRRASAGLVNAARAVNFLRRKVGGNPVYTKRATAFLADFLKDEPEGDGEADE